MNNFTHFLTGSQLYGLSNENSDYDYLVLIENTSIPYPHLTNPDITVMPLSSFKESLQTHDLKALEVYYSNVEYFRKNYSIDHSINKSKLRRSVSSTVSNSHVKSKKKIRDGEVYIGVKSYWHTIRILTMYLDYARNSTFNPSGFSAELKPIYDDIMSYAEDPDVNTIFSRLVEKYDPLARELLHEFRLLCPLEGK